ncbi:hypothetical protein Prudu_008175 [Prunus dulcis]|uniref:Squalene cyclase C-terminal domain-containing protein n=1 Tax=Prunus dulcis TaxID=3755 RepID=A0A4Y1R3S4_PRUDU|nr:hypothetical protein Prudu_008175 [Prunus dulcis]
MRCLAYSTADHGWPISDCTAEGLKAVLLLSKLPTGTVGESLDMKRLYDAVNVTLSLQNDDGGFATYELTRSYQWLETGDEVGLRLTVYWVSAYAMREEIESCIARAAKFIEKIQATDGSWYPFHCASKQSTKSTQSMAGGDL